MKKFTALILMAVMLLSTACSSTPKANKFPLGQETVNTIITDNKLPLTAEKLEITNDVEGLTVEYYNLKDNFTSSPVGSFSTADSQQGKAVSITNWAIIGDFFAGGEYMDCAVKTVCAAYGQFKDTASLEQLLVEDYKNMNFIIESGMGYWYASHEGIYFMATFVVEDEDTAVLCDFTLMEKDYFKNYLELNNTQSWAQQIYSQEFE